MRSVLTFEFRNIVNIFNIENLQLRFIQLTVGPTVRDLPCLIIMESASDEVHLFNLIKKTTFFPFV